MQPFEVWVAAPSMHNGRTEHIRARGLRLE